MLLKNFGTMVFGWSMLVPGTVACVQSGVQFVGLSVSFFVLLLQTKRKIFISQQNFVQRKTMHKARTTRDCMAGVVALKLTSTKDRWGTAKSLQNEVCFEFANKKQEWKPFYFQVCNHFILHWTSYENKSYFSAYLLEEEGRWGSWSRLAASKLTIFFFRSHWFFFFVCWHFSISHSKICWAFLIFSIFFNTKQTCAKHTK